MGILIQILKQNNMNSKDLINKAEELLKTEGVSMEDKTNEETLREYILPAMESSKDILSSVYSFQSREREGLLGKIKTKIQQKIIFTVINVIEKQSMRQQKFNELTYRAVEKLIEENENLKKQLNERNP